MINRIILLFVFALSMAYCESAVVVYLRALYYPEGFSVDLRHISSFHYLTEFGREAATLLMLASISLLSSRKWPLRLGTFLFLFGIWDIFYYIFLYLLLRWPPHLAAKDVLFLIPFPWIAPVWLPISISCLLIAIGFILMLR